MLRRDLRHALRFPMTTLSGMMLPVFFMLLFAGVFGNTLRAGLGGAIPAGGRYIDYLTPGVVLLTAAGCAEATAIGVSTDMTEGIVARFRTMAITRTSVLTGRVLGSLLRSLVSGVLVVAVAVAFGFRSSAGPLAWLAVVGLFALVSFALTWMSVSFGLLAKTAAGANSLSLIAVGLPFVSSAFVPSASMPSGVAWFARDQPFTPVIDSLRDLLTAAPLGDSAALAAAWCAGISLLGYLWARSLYERPPAH